MPLFAKGEYVISTPKAIKNGVFKEIRFGIVMANSNYNYIGQVRVRLIGRKSTSSYHTDFWRVTSRNKVIEDTYNDESTINYLEGLE